MSQNESNVKKKKKMTPRQLDNLKPFAKGSTPNPEGGRAHKPLTKALRKFTLEEFAGTLKTTLSSNVEELREIIRDPESSVVQVGAASALLKGITRGDWGPFEHLASRIIGKIPDKLQVESRNQTQLTVIDQEKLDQAVKSILERI